LLVLKVAALAVTVVEPQPHSEQFQRHRFTFMLVDKVHQVTRLPVALTVVEPRELDTTTKAQAEEQLILDLAQL